jgi:hypothetical protein
MRKGKTRIAFSNFCIAYFGGEVCWRPVVQTAVWSLVVVQPGYKIPIKLVFEKSSIAGTHGMDSAY